MESSGSKNHLYKSCMLKDSCYLCLSKMRHRGMNIKCVHKFGCPVCGSKDLVFRCVVLSNCLKNFQVAVGSTLIPEVFVACGSVQ